MSTNLNLQEILDENNRHLLFAIGKMLNDVRTDIRNDISDLVDARLRDFIQQISTNMPSMGAKTKKNTIKDTTITPACNEHKEIAVAEPVKDTKNKSDTIKNVKMYFKKEFTDNIEFRKKYINDEKFKELMESDAAKKKRSEATRITLVADIIYDNIKLNNKDLYDDILNSYNSHN
ncbi:hypothetical protein F-S17_0230 [Faustovirus]|nr:hypothetical protein F-S17_0230 [Faustovirus]QJX72996.1 hypothetical protein F-VV57_0235 [Faustovirus]QJX73503.1 hypothetical protein F-VV63_0237 [Faustovirus]QJX74007.1 hypothetical protein F-E9_253 [Faustovirus]